MECQYRCVSYCSGYSMRLLSTSSLLDSEFTPLLLPRVSLGCEWFRVKIRFVLSDNFGDIDIDVRHLVPSYLQ
jgi:hypothetical protein